MMAESVTRRADRPENRCNVFVNGELKHIECSLTVAGLIQHLSLPPDRIAVEVNKSIVRKRDWENTPVPDAAQIEIVEFVGGG